ncbi:MAG: hypothetical protein HYX75_19665 [Acidobacteria bacterium]|nr:hypothetical protein [Acidobacteriota bacterium]
MRCAVIGSFWISLLLCPGAGRAEYLVRLEDGTTVRASTGPIVEGELCYIRCVDGRTYSIRRTRVAGVEVVAPDRPASPAIPPPTGRVEPRTYTNGDLVYWRMTEEGWRAKEEYARRAVSGLAPPMEEELASYLDAQGHGEAYWRPRAREATVAVETARTEHERLKEEYDRLVRIFGEPAGMYVSHPGLYGFGYYGYNASVYLMDLRSRLQQAIDQLRWAERRLDELRDDARKAGALPGWLR